MKKIVLKFLDQSPISIIAKGTQMIELIKQSLEQNKTEMLKALEQGNMQDLRDLKTQRDNLKDMLILELETQLTKAA